MIKSGFDDVLINNLPIRAAMGLPQYFVNRSTTSIEPTTWVHLITQGPCFLSTCVEGRDSDLETRLAAGYVLALLGDPRLRPFDPIMIDIPASEARIGLPLDQIDTVLREARSLGLHQEWIRKECPEHVVNLKPYRIGKYPVTNFEYKIFLEESRFPELPTSWSFGGYPFWKSNHPVTSVTPEAADAYALWLSQKTNRNFRLPTEAEWEYAASGPDHLCYPWGNEYLPGHANTVEECLLDTSPVGAFSVGNSPFGVCDMGGNVEEFVAENYTPYPGGTLATDDLFMTNSSYRVARGGSFTRFRDLARTRRRHGHYPSALYAMGFRLAE